MLKGVVPAFEWLRHYRSRDLKGDLTAGTIVVIMVVPQSMAYAMLAGLPPVMGLYASTLPLIVYALFGSSRQLAVGPVAIVSLLVFAGLSSLAEAKSEEYIKLVLLLSFLVGIIQMALGFLRMGFLVNFLSQAVISGFTLAAALIILVSQAHHLLGTPSSGGHTFLYQIEGITQHIGETQGITLGLGLASLLVLFFFKKRFPHFPAAILVVLGGTISVYGLGLDRLGVKVVGEIPRGLPAFSLPAWGLEEVKSLIPAVMTILFVGFMESISVAKLIAVKEKYKVDSNQELKALGMANVVGSLFSAYPVTGGFSRTAVNYQGGARTGLASLITAGLVVLTLLFLTPLFYYLPKAVLAAIVMAAVLGLVDLKEAKRLWELKKVDGWTLLLTFGGTLGLGSERGILAGVVFSLLVFIWRSAHPHAAVLGYLEKGNVFRNLKHYPEAKVFPRVLLLRIDASLFFANMAFVDDLLRKNLAEKPDTQWVIVDLAGVNEMDAVAIDTLDEIMDHYSDRGITFLFAGMKGPVRELVGKASWAKKYGSQIEFLSLQQALQSIGKF